MHITDERITKAREMSPAERLYRDLSSVRAQDKRPSEEIAASIRLIEAYGDWREEQARADERRKVLDAVVTDVVQQSVGGESFMKTTEVLDTLRHPTTKEPTP